MNFMDRKVWAGGLTGAASSALVWGLQAKFGITIPPEVAAMLITFLVTSVAYIVPPSVKDVIKRIDGTIITAIAHDPNIPLVIANPAPPPVAKTTVVNGMSGRVMVLPLALVLLLPALGACSTVKTVESAAPAVTATPITQAVQTVRDMPPEEKWRLTCLAADGLYIGYVSMAAPKLSDATNIKVQAGYEGFKAICANKPTDYASAIVALVQAFNAFKAAMPAKVAS